MLSNFEASIALVLKSEGGYVNSPADPGGETNFGISKRAYPSVDIKNLTVAAASDIYRRDYWNAIHGDELPAGLDYAVLDYAVNSGVSRAVKALQTKLSVPADGVMGPVTLAAAQSNVSTIILTYTAARLDFLQSLSTWHSFGTGWTNRVIAVRAAALAMVQASPAKPVPYPPLPSPAPVGGKIIVTPPTARKFDVGAILSALLAIIKGLFK